MNRASKRRRFRPAPFYHGPLRPPPPHPILLAQTVTLADKMGVLPTDDSPKFSWDTAAGTGPALSAKLMGVIDPGKVFLEKVQRAAMGGSARARWGGGYITRSLPFLHLHPRGCPLLLSLLQLSHPLPPPRSLHYPSSSRCIPLLPPLSAFSTPHILPPVSLLHHPCTLRPPSTPASLHTPLPANPLPPPPSHPPPSRSTRSLASSA